MGPDHTLTTQLHDDLAAITYALQEKPELIARALTDAVMRDEMRELVRDLFSVVEAIFEEQGEQFPLPTGVDTPRST